MLVKSQESRVESRNPDCGLRIADIGLNDPLNPISDIRYPKCRRGFTLIELLIVIMIISILATLVLGVAAVAMETARQSKSRHMVTRLHTLVTEFYDTFKTRRVKLRESGIDGIETQVKAQFPTVPPSPTNVANAAKQGNALAEARLYAMREMMLMEVPDRWSDVILTDVGLDNDTALPTPASSAKAPFYLNGRTALANAYLRRYASLAVRTNSISGKPNTASDMKRNQGAECLYMVVTMACGDGEARSLFAESSIGDVDGDGAPEFLDGWGHPINFLRWAPGFDSQIELNANNLSTNSADASLPTFWATAAAKDHDPFDMYRRDPFAFRLVPLIYSPGRDEDSGLFAIPNVVTWRVSTVQTITFNPGNTSPFIASPVLNPYVQTTDPGPPIETGYMGSKLNLVNPANHPGDAATDDVHNHLLGLR
jgi:prepilin-type N-terminal cleavage/methylation domain-containing protein